MQERKKERGDYVQRIQMGNKENKNIELELTIRKKLRLLVRCRKRKKKKKRSKSPNYTDAMPTHAIL